LSLLNWNGKNPPRHYKTGGGEELGGVGGATGPRKCFTQPKLDYSKSGKGTKSGGKGKRIVTVWTKCQVLGLGAETKSEGTGHFLISRRQEPSQNVTLL